MKHGTRSAPREGRQRSQRQLRVGEMVRHELVSILERDGIRDPDLAGVSVTVSEVRVSPDLRHATAFVMPLGGANAEVVIGALRRAAPYLRRLLGERVTLKRLPELTFEPDTSFDRAAEIERLLDAAADHDGPHPGAGRVDGDGS